MIKSLIRQRFQVVVPIFLIGFVALVTGAIGLFDYNRLTLEFDPSREGFIRFSKWLFESVAILLLEEPNPAPSNIMFSISRVCSVLLYTIGIPSLLISLSVQLKNSILRFEASVLSHFTKESVVVIGLGYMGGKIARDAINEGYSVYGVCRDVSKVEIEELRKEGVIIVNGDATSKKVRDKARVGKSVKVFISVGDDTKNAEIAKMVKEDVFFAKKRKNQLDCFVHIAELEFAEVLQSALNSSNDNQIEFNVYSNRKLAADRLCLSSFLNRGLGFFSDANASEHMPNFDTSKKFHAIVIGFGNTAQSCVQNFSRLAHFSSFERPRITVFGDETEELLWDEFKKKHPAFTASDFKEPVNEVNGLWSEKKFRPSSRDYMTIEENPNAVEYAAVAEFVRVSTKADLWTYNEDLRDRIGDDEFDPLFVICKEDENMNFMISLNLKKQFQHLYGKAISAKLYTYLPSFQHLVDLTGSKESTKKNDALVEVIPFGVKDKTISYNAITTDNLAKRAEQILLSYQAVSNNKEPHRDFALSNLEAVLCAEIKFEALGLCFRKGMKKGESHMLVDYVSNDILGKVKELRLRNGLPLKLDTKDYEDFEDKILLKRLAFTSDLELDVEGIEVADLAKKVVDEFSQELKLIGKDIDVAARIEHNRYMGERLMKGWRYGEKKNGDRLRPSFVSWDALSDYKDYDRQQLPSLVLAMADRGYYAYQKAELI